MFYISTNAESLEKAQMEGWLRPETAFRIRDAYGMTEGYAYTSDGEGLYFYDSKIELERNH